MGALNISTGELDGRKASPATLLATILLVFASAASVIALSHFAGRVAGIWFANAVLLSILMKYRRRDWVWLFGLGLIANAMSDMLTYSLPLSLFFGCLNILEVIAVALPLRLLKLDRDFTKPYALLAFYAMAAIAPLLGGISCAAFFHIVKGTPFVETASNWYAADALGLMIVVPPLMTVKASALKTMFKEDQIVWTIALIGIVVSAIALNFFLRSYPIAFLFFPAVMLLTFQRGFAGGTIGLFLTSLYLLVPALAGQSSGPLHAYSIRGQVMVTQIFIAVIGLSVVLVGAALEERRRLEQWLASTMMRAEVSREEAIVAKEFAEKANRTKSMFLATMSHELRTPLNAVIGFAELMNSEPYGPLGDNRYREYTDVIQSAGHHLLDLINDILDMSKIEAGKLEIHRERLNISELIADGLSLMSENAAAGGVELTSDLPHASLIIDADRRAMKQILLNLLSNAIKFTPSGGRVIAKAALLENRVVLSVRDTGIGIPQDQIYRLGNPFVQIRNSAGTSQKGTGLGLALVKSLAELQDGNFKIESEENRGTIVSVSFPTAENVSLAA